MVESCIVMLLLCLILFGLLQVSYVVSSRNVISYATVATARARAVGLNDFMLYKVSHYATIPTAGPVKVPSTFTRTEGPPGTSMGARWSNAVSPRNTPQSQRTDYEVGIRKAYHLSNTPQLLMDYDNWSPAGEADVYLTLDTEENDRIAIVTLSQQIPLVMPFSRVVFWHLPEMMVDRNGREEFYPGKQITATAYIEDHSEYYLNNVE